MPPGNCIDGTSTCSGPHGPCGAGAVRATTSFMPLQYKARYCLRYVLYCADISPTGPGMTGEAAAGLPGTHALESLLQYSQRLGSGMAFGETRAMNAAPPRPDG